MPSRDTHLPQDTAFLTFPSDEGGSVVSPRHASWAQMGCEFWFMTLKQTFSTYELMGANEGIKCMNSTYGF